MSSAMTTREKLEMAYRQLTGPERILGKETFKWPNKGPMSIAAEGRPNFLAPLLIAGGLIAYLVALAIYNWDLNMRLEADPWFATQVNWDYVDFVNAPGLWAFVALVLDGGFIFIYLFLATWNSCKYQIEPAPVDTLEGDAVNCVLRVQEHQQMWPPPKGEELEEYLLEVEEYLAAEQIKEAEKEAAKKKEEEKKGPKSKESDIDEEEPAYAPPPSDKTLVRPKTLSERFTSIYEAADRVERYLDVEKRKTISKAERLHHMRLEAAKIGRLLEDFGFYSTYLGCAGNLDLIVVSEYPLVGPEVEGGKIEVADEYKDRYSTKYVEFKMRKMKQRTFTVHGTNDGKAVRANFVELARHRYHAKTYEFMETINITVRKVHISPIVFLAWSDGQLERLQREGVKSRGDRSYPSKQEIQLVKFGYQLSLAQRMENMLKLAIEEILRLYDSSEQTRQQYKDEAIEDAANLALKAFAAGKLKHKPPNRVIQFINQHIATIAKWFIILLMLIVVASLVHAIVSGTPIFSWWGTLFPDGGTTTIPVTTPEVAQPP